MNHKAIIFSVSCLIVAIIVGGVVYVEWPESPTPQAAQPSQQATSMAKAITAATSSLITSVPKPTAGPPMVEAQAGVASASPSIIAVNEPTDVIVTVQLTDARLIPNSVNLQRLDATGKVIAVLGNLNDAGTNGDTTANDKIFTIRKSFIEATTTPVKLQISWALKGVLKRAVSNTVAVTVEERLAGIDADHDGVRDDVQRYIEETYQNSEKTRAAVTQFAIEIQDSLLLANDREAAINHANTHKAFDCLLYIYKDDIDRAIDISRELNVKVINTPERGRASFQFNSHLGGPKAEASTQLYELDKLKSACSFDPDILED